MSWEDLKTKIEIETSVAGVYADVTDDYVKALWSTASRQSWGTNFEPGRATVTFKNQTGALEYLVSIPPGITDVSRAIRITSQRGAATPVVMWQGYLKNVYGPDVPGQAKTTTVTCRTGLARSAKSNRAPVAAVGAGELVGVRVGRILNSIAWPAGLRTLDPIAHAFTAGTTLAGAALAELQLSTVSVAGELYEDVKTGHIVFVGTTNKAALALVAAKLGVYSDWYAVPGSPGTWWASAKYAGADVDEVVNYVDVDDVVGSGPWIYNNTASRTAHGLNSYIRADLLQTPGNYGQLHAYFVATKLPVPLQQVTQVVVTDGDATFVDALLALNLLDNVVVGTGLAPGGGLSQVQGIQFTSSPGRPATSPAGRSDQYSVRISLDNTEGRPPVTPDP